MVGGKCGVSWFDCLMESLLMLLILQKACVERLRLQNRFGVKCCQLQQIEDEAALSKSGIVALPILCKTQSEKTLPDVAPLLSSAVPLSHREAAEDRGICRRVTHKKAASSGE